MNLVIITALIAVCGAAKLDRTYLPPASAKTAGGSPGSLQTPLQNSLGNNGLGGLPKGSFTNDFEGVVVDAAAPGTRASGSEATGLGAPRIAYGSTNSKVGEAGFKTNANAFNAAGQTVGTQRFQTGQGPNFQTGGSERPRAALDRAANILRFDSEVGPEGFSYGFETDNGIVAEENGVATNGVQAQGGFSYTGDDGQVYSVSYTADEGGYQPKGDHLPTPPPIPEEILKSLEQNAREEAAGLVDDGSYDAQKYNAGSDYSESDNTQQQYNHQSSRFGQADATASGSFISQNNQPFRPGQSTQKQSRLPGSSVQLGHSQALGHKTSEHGENTNAAVDATGFAEQSSDDDQPGVTNNRFGSESSSGQIGIGNKQSKGSSNRFGQGSSDRFGASNVFQKPGQSGFASAQSQITSIGSSVSAQSSQGLGNRNEYLPPTNGFNHPQNGRPQSSRPQADSSFDSTNQFAQEANTDEEGSGNFVALSQQKLQKQKGPQGTPSTSYNQPISSVSGQSNFGINSISSQTRPSNNGTPSNRFGQGSQSSQASASFDNRNEYLPPSTVSNQNRPFSRPSGSFSAGSQFNQQSAQSTDIHSSSQQDSPSHSSFTSSSTSTADSQPALGSQHTHGFQNQQATSNGRPSSSTVIGKFPSAQSSLGLNTPKTTSVPETELTTPIDDSSSAQSSQTSTSNNGSFGSRPSNGRPSQSPFSRPQVDSRPFGQTQTPAFPTQTSLGQFNQQSQFEQQSQGAGSDDSQFSPSTQRPSFGQQPQGPDDSYYYNQPSQPFNTPQSPSRFPSAPSNQFNRVTQSSAFAQSSSQFSPGSTRYPRPPTVAPTSFAPTQSQYQSSGLSGITQASISPFPSQAPTQSSQFNTESRFGSRPQAVNHMKPTFGQQTAFTQSSFGPQPSSQRPGSRPTSVQSQPQTQTFEQQDFNQNQPENDDTSSPSVATQQSNGEIYTYTKPTQTRPASTSGQFGQKVQTQFGGQSKPQVGNDNEESQTSNKPQFSQISQTSQPQFGAQPSKPQFVQNNFALQNSQQQSTFSSRPQFNQPARTPFGQTASAQASFGSQSTYAQALSGATEPSKTQFGSPSRPSGQLQTESQDDTDKAQDSQSQFGFGSPCCQSSKPSSGSQPSRPTFGAQPTRPSFGVQPARPSFGAQSQFGQSQFGSQSTSFTGAQGTSPTTSSFAGKGEVFDASRKPPASSFDSESGYHY